MSVSPERFDLRTIAPRPWKNGAGLTREIAFGGTNPVDFDWRISVAEVERSAPFSAFSGVDRCILLLRGAGMRLRSAGDAEPATRPAIDHALTTPLAPFRFAGEVPLAATLVDGPSSDFNVMTRRGVWRSEVCIVNTACRLRPADVTLAMCIQGTWKIEGMTLAAMQGLLLRLPPGVLLTLPPGEGVGAIATLLVVHLDREPPR